MQRSLLKQFLCRSLQCLISALTQVGGGGLLFRFTGSVVLRGGRAAAGRYRCVGSTHSVPATLGLPPLTGVCSPRLHCSGPRLLYMKQALRCMQFPFWVFHQSVDLVGPAFCAFPSLSSSGRQELDGCTLPWCGAPSPLRGPSLSFHVPVGCVWLVSILESWPLATTLLADVDHPESQEVFG